ncbi:MAG TPA: helix-turn-helix domain-containing protein [Bryobacteraceae bacterium]|jgi:hypothetical protein
MAHKLDGYRQQILDLREAGESVRKIAERIGQPPSTVQHFLKQESGESRESVAVDQSAVLERIDHVALRVDELARELKRSIRHRNETLVVLGWIGGAAVALFSINIAEWVHHGGAFFIGQGYMAACVVIGWQLDKRGYLRWLDWRAKEVWEKLLGKLHEWV